MHLTSDGSVQAIGHLLTSENAGLRVEGLQCLTDRLPLYNTDTLGQIALILHNRWDRESVDHVRHLLRKVILTFSLHPAIASLSTLQNLTKEFLTASASTLPASVQTSYLTTLSSLTQHRPAWIVNLLTRPDEFSNVVRQVTQHTLAYHVNVRVGSLDLYVRLATLAHHVTPLSTSADTLGLVSHQQLSATVSRYIQDPHPKVRKAALELLYQIHLAGYILQPDLYAVFVDCLKDDYEYIRLAALRLVWTISKLYPEEVLQPRKQDVADSTRLVDNAFVKICDMVNDISMNIRTEACILLGSYYDVQSNYLSQTLSKKIMSHLKRRHPFGKSGGKNDQLGRSPPSSGSGGSHQGSHPKSRRGMIPVAEGDLDVESNEFRILDSGACGAFVHGLEDEYREVRNAAITSLCELCLRSAEFAKQAVDYLVDIFNDEIDYVRLNAILSLAKIAGKHPIVMDQEQLQIILGVMEDANPRIRRGIHDLISSVEVKDLACLRTVISSLIDSMKRRSSDQMSIYQCLGQLGRRHFALVDVPVVEKLLNLERGFLVQEMSQNDPAYIAQLALVLNAARHRTSLLSVLPLFVFNHIPYLHSMYRTSFPDPKWLPVPKDKPSDYLANTTLPETVSLDQLQSISTLAETVRTQVPLLLRLLKLRDRRRAERLITLLSRQLDVAKQGHPSWVSNCRFLGRFLDSVGLVLQCQHSLHQGWYLTDHGFTLARQLMTHAYILEHLYLGHSAQTLLSLALLRLFAHVMYIIKYLGDPAPPTGIYSKHAVRPTLLERVLIIEQRAMAIQLSIPWILTLKALISQSELTDAQLGRGLMEFLDQFVVQPCGQRDFYKRLDTTILSPEPNPDKPHQMLHRFPLAFTFEAELLWCTTRIDRLCVKVTLPDGTTQLFQPPLTHFQPVHRWAHTLSTDITVSLPSVGNSSTSAG
ncbi:hypothetical protein IWQ61_001967 [Dispira simplex]|nr:hypothetical protein IWQ61_001967 [Dispira simplex]